MVAKADAGAVVDQEGVEIGPTTTAYEAYERVVPCAEKILARQIDALLSATAIETPQDESKVTYFSRRGPEDGRIDWKQTSTQIFNLVRAVTDPYPGAFTQVGDARLLVWWAEPGRSGPQTPGGQPGEILSLDPLTVATGDGPLKLTRTEWRGTPAEPLQVGSVL
jgi:methionyl-tRNA formyltransferase